MSKVHLFVACLFTCFTFNACSNPIDAEDEENLEAFNAEMDAVSSATAEEGERIAVPSDPRASYQLLDVSKMPNGNVEALTKRNGPSGTSFARREISCNTMQFRYLGEGDSKEEALVERPNVGKLSDILPPSISATITLYVCSKN